MADAPEGAFDEEETSRDNSPLSPGEITKKLTVMVPSTTRTHCRTCGSGRSLYTDKAGPARGKITGTKGAPVI